MISRGKYSLWKILQKEAILLDYKVLESKSLQVIVDELFLFIEKAKFLAPFDFFSYLLEICNIKKRFVNSFGIVALEVLDEFIRCIYSYENASKHSLESFLYWFIEFYDEVKFGSKSRDTTQVKTVHGVKGLQSPIVILPDTIYFPKVSDFLFRSYDGLIWVYTTKSYISKLMKIRLLHQQIVKLEYHRLLYVAMTRAERHLIITGWNIKKKQDNTCWYGLVIDVIKRFDQIITTREGIYIVQKNCKEVHNIKDFIYYKKTYNLKFSLPIWFFKNQKIKLDQEKILLIGNKNIVNISFVQGGIWIHFLLENLSNVSLFQRKNFARMFISYYNLSDFFLKRIYREVFFLLEDIQLKYLWDKKANYEVPILGKIKGIIECVYLDYLLINLTHAYIIEYKTDLSPPNKISFISNSYINQIKKYTLFIEYLYPTHKIKIFILWTSLGCLQEIPIELIK